MKEVTATERGRRSNNKPKIFCLELQQKGIVNLASIPAIVPEVFGPRKTYLQFRAQQWFLQTRYYSV